MTEKINVDVYGNTAPAAAKFGEGVSDLKGVNEATSARSNLSDKQSRMPELIDKDLRYTPAAKR